MIQKRSIQYQEGIDNITRAVEEIPLASYQTIGVSGNNIRDSVLPEMIEKGIIAVILKHLTLIS
jgi:hypothetical protein